MANNKKNAPVKKATLVKKPIPVAVKKVSPAPREKQPSTMLIDFSPESKALIIGLTEAMKGLSFGTSVRNTPVAAPAPAASPAPASSGPVTSGAPKNLMTEIKTTIAEKAGQGKTQGIVKLLGDWGVQNAAGLTDDQHEGFLTALKAL